MKSNCLFVSVKKIVSVLTILSFVLTLMPAPLSSAKMMMPDSNILAEDLAAPLISGDILDSPELSPKIAARDEQAVEEWVRIYVAFLLTRSGVDVTRDQILQEMMGSFNEANLAHVQTTGTPLDNAVYLIDLLVAKFGVERPTDDRPDQLTWVVGPYTPAQLKDAQQDTREYLGQAGRERRIFDLRDGQDIEEQVLRYAARRTDPDRQLPYWKRRTAKEIELGKKKEKQEILTKRLQAANGFFYNTIHEITDDHLQGMYTDRLSYVKDQILNKTRLALIYDEEGNPSFYSNMADVTNPEFLAVTASSGGFRYEGFKETDEYRDGDRARSFYLSLHNVEGYMDLVSRIKEGEAIYNDGIKQSQKDVLDAFRYKVLHEFKELENPDFGHINEIPAVKDQITFYDMQVFEAWYKKQQIKLAEKRKRDKNRVVVDITSANISKFLLAETDGIIDQELVEAAEEALGVLKADGRLIDYKMIVAGGDMHVQTTSANANREENEAALAAALVNVFTSVLRKANEKGLLDTSKITIDDFEAASLNKKVESFEIRKAYKPLVMSERAADPFGVMVAVNGYIGAFNLIIWEILCNPMVNAGLTIDSDGDRGYMIEIWDSVEDKTVTFDSITENKAIRVYASEPGRYVIVAAYTKKEHKAGEAEPVITVSAKRINDDGKRAVGNENPVLIIRAQSGLPAWGELIEGFAHGMPVLTYGGEENPYMLAMRPTSLKEAAKWKKSEMGHLALLIGYGYQTHQNGVIGITADISSDKTLNRVRDGADEWNEIFSDIPEELDHMKAIEPLKKPFAYDRTNKVEAARQKLLGNARLKDNPKKPTPEELAQGKRYRDPIVYGKTQDVTVSNIKVDVGSVPGHYRPHPAILEGMEDVLNIAKEVGIEYARAYVRWVERFKPAIKKRAITREIDAEEYAAELHYLAVDYLARVKAGDANLEAEIRDVIDGANRIAEAEEAFLFLEQPADVRDDPMHKIQSFLKPWHAGDDVQMTMFHFQEQEHPLIHLLAFEGFIYAAEGAEMAKPYGYKQDILVNSLVSGNIQGAGPGYAEILVNEGEKVLLLSADKSAPGAFTNPLIFWMRRALKKGKFQDGLIAEIWDINNSRRVFLDMTNPEDYAAALDLLSAPEEFAIKRLWTTTEKWDRESDITRILSNSPVASASTERLVLTAGKYVGKDDPTLLIKVSEDGFEEEDLLEVFSYPIMALGFMRGSHTGPLMPDVQEYALPHRFDGPPPITGYFLDGINKDGTVEVVRQAFTRDDLLAEVHDTVLFITETLRRQGWMPPHVVAGGDKEYTSVVEVQQALRAQQRDLPASDEAQRPFDRAVSEEPIHDAVKGYQANISALTTKLSTIWVERSILNGAALDQEVAFFERFTNLKTTLKIFETLDSSMGFDPAQDVIVASKETIGQLAETSADVPDFIGKAYMMPAVEVGHGANPYIREILLGARLLREVKKEDIPAEGETSTSAAYNSVRKILSVISKRDVTAAEMASLIPGETDVIVERLKMLLKMFLPMVPLDNRAEMERIREFLWAA